MVAQFVALASERLVGVASARSPLAPTTGGCAVALLCLGADRLDRVPPAYVPRRQLGGAEAEHCGAGEDAGHHLPGQVRVAVSAMARLNGTSGAAAIASPRSTDQVLAVQPARGHPAGGAGGSGQVAVARGDASTTVHSYMRTGCMILAPVVVWQLGVGPAPVGVPAGWAGSALAEFSELVVVGVDDPPVGAAGFLAALLHCAGQGTLRPQPPRCIKWPRPTRRTRRPTAGSPAPQRPARNGRVERSVRKHARR
jgi:hypothetical protein